MRSWPKLSGWLQSLGIERTDDDLAREQYRVIAQQMPLLYLLVFINSVFLSAVASDHVSFIHASVFPAVAAVAMVVRGYTWRKRSIRYSGNESMSEIRKALRGNIIAANVMAIVMGIWAGSLVFSLPASIVSYVPLFAILSMIACTYCLLSLPLAAYSIIISGSSMITLAMIATGEKTMVTMAVNIAMGCLVIIYMVSHQYAQLRRIVQSRSALTEQQEITHKMAHQDQLTGLPNRRAFLDALESRKLGQAEATVALALLDLNGFKPVNDTYGHALGDKLLAIVGGRLRNVIGDEAIVARLGGDEFAILFQSDADIGCIYDLTENARDAIMAPIQINDINLSVGAAFGLVSCENMPDDPMELLRNADIALYEAKRKKPNAISLFEDHMDEKVKRSTIIEQSLSDEAMLGEITLHYQPIFEARSGKHVGFEALARWHHPTLGNISPKEFIEAAERSGCMISLTLHLFEQALATAKQWNSDLVLSFNLSASGLTTSGLHQIIPDLLQKHEFDPGRLALEVTETALLRDKIGARNVLASLQQAGIRIVLDDFGAGHASISYLRNIHFDGIKLDGTLISEIEHSAKARELLVGVLHLCRAVGATITAEMIENEAQLALLRSLAITYVQGYLLGEPVPAEMTFKAEPAKQAQRKRLLASGQ
jgi:diguanylate cyclase (GGDEF)-like protein